MTFEDFDKLLESMFKDEREIGQSKGVEYTRGRDRLDNFKRLAGELDLDAKIVWWIYFKKHVDAILHYVVTGESDAEGIESRITDARVYLSLLRGLVEDGIQEQREIEIAQKSVAEYLEH